MAVLFADQRLGVREQLEDTPGCQRRSVFREVVGIALGDDAAPLTLFAELPTR